MFSVYEGGACFSPDVLDITKEDIMARFVEVGQTKKINTRGQTKCPYTEVPFSIPNFENYGSMTARTNYKAIIIIALFILVLHKW